MTSNSERGGSWSLQASKSGNSAVITLPSSFRKRCGIDVGDHVMVEYPDDSSMFIRPVASEAERRTVAIDELIAFSEDPKRRQSDFYPDGKEEIRDILEERYVQGAHRH